MKKLRTLSNLRSMPVDLLKRTGVLVISLGLCFAFWTATSGAASKNKNGAKGQGGDNGKCIVCHNEHNFHEISIPCDQVDKYLKNHPGDHAGPCQVTSVTNK